MRCPNCGQDIPEGTRFCGYCGHRLGAEPAATSARQVPADFDDDAPTRLEPAARPQELLPPPGPAVIHEKAPPPPTSVAATASPTGLARQGGQEQAPPDADGKRSRPFWRSAIGFGAVAALAVLAGVGIVGMQPRATPAPIIVVVTATPEAPTVTSAPPTSAPEPTREIPTATSAPPTPAGMLYHTDYSGWTGWPELDDDTMYYGPVDAEYLLRIMAPEDQSSSIVVLEPDEGWEVTPPFTAYLWGYPVVGTDPSLSIGITLRYAEEWQYGALLFRGRPFQGDYSISSRTPEGEWGEPYALHAGSPLVQMTDDGGFDVAILAGVESIDLLVNNERVDSIVPDWPGSGFLGISISVGEEGWAEYVAQGVSVWR